MPLVNDEHQVPPEPPPGDDPMPDKNPSPDDEPVPDHHPVVKPEECVPTHLKT